jgi:hypothetical protein
MVGTGVGGSDVWVGRGIAVAGNVAVTKIGVAVPFSLAVFKSQPVRIANDKSRRKVIE